MYKQQLAETDFVIKAEITSMKGDKAESFDYLKKNKKTYPIKLSYFIHIYIYLFFFPKSF